jgi:hypothetical protein
MSLAAIDHCRENARRCTARAAAISNNPVARQFFKDCAAMWEQFAADRERLLSGWRPYKSPRSYRRRRNTNLKAKPRL